MKILITPRSFASISKKPMEMLEEKGYEIKKNESGKPLNNKKLLILIDDVDGIIIGIDDLNAGIIKQAHNLKVISKYGVGVDNIDIEAATEYGIIVANVPDFCIDEVSTHAMALILACARGIILLDSKIKEKKWDFTLAKPLFRTHGKILGLFGLGNIARAVAKKASGFGLKIIAYDPYISKADHEIELVKFSKLLSVSDFISIHAPLTIETRHYFGENELEKNKKTDLI